MGYNEAPRIEKGKKLEYKGSKRRANARARPARREADRMDKQVLIKRIRKIFASSNNHYAGHAPATTKLFHELSSRGI
jgi:hypothetical protein